MKMGKQQFNKDLGAYVSFALRIKPPTTISGHFDDNGNFLPHPVELNLKDINRLSDREFSTVEKLMDKYQIFRPYLPPSSRLSDLRIVDDPEKEECDYKKSGDVHHVIRVNEEQLNIAKSVAERVESILDSYQNGEHRKAKTTYIKLQSYLAEKRAAFIGDFRSLDDVEAAFLPPVDCCGQNDSALGLFVFIAVEIYVAS